jgi:hypothetical protein
MRSGVTRAAEDPDIDGSTGLGPRTFNGLCLHSSVAQSVRM